MLRIVHPGDPFSASRLVELLSTNPPWQRSLWGVGITLMLDELCEAASAHRAGILSEPSVKRLVSSVARVSGTDPALTNAEKSLIQNAAREVVRPLSLAWETVLQLARQLNDNYLGRWSSVYASGRASPERFARLIASHLIDLGFSSEHLHRFVKERLFVREASITLSELCEELADLARGQPSNVFEVLVAFGPSRVPVADFPSHWLRPPAISSWLRENRFSTAGVRPTIGVVLRVTARDAFGAVSAAAASVDRLDARAAIGAGGNLAPLPNAWVKGHPEPLQFPRNTRGVRVEALSREHLVFVDATNSNVDTAIELLSHLEYSSPSVAVAGGWGAIEGLLGEPGDRAAAADHLATLVACSLPRAELTGLSYVVAKHSEEQKRELDRAGTNRERAALLARWINDGHSLNLPHISDNAAVNRLRRLFARPSDTLHDIELAASDAFHRLYRQRNLILHGGTANSVVLSGSLRTVSKLAGAGIDRVVHGFYVQQLRPLELVARARLSLASLTSASAAQCVDLLEGSASML